MKHLNTKSTLARLLIYILVSSAIGIIGPLTGIYIYARYFDEDLLRKKNDYSYTVYRARAELHYQGCKDALVEEIDKYIQTVGPGSSLNGLYLLEACEKYDVDIRFVLSQGHIESHFGTKGIAYKTNSVFNVMSFDGLSANQIIKAGKGYSHPDHSVEPYLKLLTTKYLVNKTEEDMFLDFKNVDGKRYASAKDYEQKLLQIYNNLDSIANITTTYKQYKQYKSVVGQ
ncbi:MAG: glucosaminidase domain-containing protein [Parabacteroides sp.]|nr:glucosaminidase domain-containing protein [Parabacteroides sp.]